MSQKYSLSCIYFYKVKKYLFKNGKIACLKEFLLPNFFLFSLQSELSGLTALFPVSFCLVLDFHFILDVQYFSKRYLALIALIVLDVCASFVQIMSLIKGTTTLRLLFSPLNSTVDCFQKCAFILWPLDTNTFFLSYEMLPQVHTACWFSPDPLLGSLLILYHQPPKVYLLSQRCLPWFQLLWESCTVSLGTFKSPFFSLLQGILKTSCQGPPPSIFSVFL